MAALFQCLLTEHLRRLGRRPCCTGCLIADTECDGVLWCCQARNGAFAVMKSKSQLGGRWKGMDEDISDDQVGEG